MRFAVETWAPEFGAATDAAGLDASDATVDVAVEVAPADWAPIGPSHGRPPYASVLFVDGVQRIDARVWVIPEAGSSQLGVCASWAAGAVHCDRSGIRAGGLANGHESRSAGPARVVAAEIRRGALCPGDGVESIATRHGTYEARAVGRSGDDPVHAALGQARGDLEARVAIEVAVAKPAELVVVDGPLGDRRLIPGALGYIKAHHVAYLPPRQQSVVTALASGERTPLFRIGDERFRYSWYLRLPSPPIHPSAGVVRCELPGELPLADAIVTADRATVTLPLYATRPHQDPRAPQNLHPIAGLERALRRRLGDPALLERALRRAAASS
ncbi:MAG: hypothetical protein ACRD2C_18340 [Acidimicrobiales bacterium]